MAAVFLVLCVATGTLNFMAAAADVPLHGPSPVGRALPNKPPVKLPYPTTAMPVKPMIDMRGFPDTEGNCFRGAGFYRNKTDCTQFYRCVDYFSKKRYTFYRFMCGPMTVFDESRSLCTGPDMAVPKCNETSPTPSPAPPSPPTPTQTTPTEPTPPTTLPPTPPSPPTPTPLIATDPTPPTPPAPTPEIPTEPTPPIPTEPTPPTPPVPNPPSPPTPTPPIPTEPTPPTPPVPNPPSPPTPTPPIPTEPTPPTPPPPTPLTPTEPTPPTPTEIPVAPKNPSTLITATDQEYYGNASDPTDESFNPGVPYGLLMQNETILTIGGATVTVPSSSILTFESKGSSGSVTNTVNGFTSAGSQAILPPGTKVTIVELGDGGRFVSRKEVVVTSTSTTIKLPDKTPAGNVQLTGQNKIYSIGKWIYSYVYVTYQSTVSYYQVISRVNTTKFNIETESNELSGNESFISGIMTIGGSTTFSDIKSGYVIKSNQDIGIVPSGGQGVIQITEGSGEISEFDIKSGTLMTVKIPEGLQGTVANLEQKMFTSSTSLIELPVGSVVSIVRITTKGETEIVQSYIVNSTSTLTTSVHSSVGILSVTNRTVTSFGQAPFSVQVLKNPSQQVYVGVINLSGDLTSSQRLESLSGIIKIGDPSLVSWKEPSSTSSSLTLGADSKFVGFGEGSYFISEESETTSSKREVRLPSGVLFAIHTNRNPGEASGLIDNIVTSSNSTMTFPAGATFGTHRLKVDGTLTELVEQEVFVTQYETIVVLPAGSLFGELKLSGNVLSGIGDQVAVDTRQDVLLNRSADATENLKRSQIARVAVLHYLKNYNLPTSIVTSTLLDYETSDTVGLVPIGTNQLANDVADKVIDEGSLVAIIPRGGAGSIVLNTVTDSKAIELVPGEMFLLNCSGKMTITQLTGGHLTDLTTKIVVSDSPADGDVYVVGSDGTLKQEDDSFRFFGLTEVVLTNRSIVGQVYLDDGKVVAIGSATFAVKELLVSQSSNRWIGLIDFATTFNLMTTTTTSTTTTTPEPCKTPGSCGPIIEAIPCPVSDLFNFKLNKYSYDCTKFTQCLREEGKEVQFLVLPCASGLYFNSETSMCDKNDKMQCDQEALNGTRGTFSIRCTGELYRYPTSTNCQHFYQCVASDFDLDFVTMFLYSCNDGLVFDEERNGCLNPLETTTACSDNLVFRSPEFIFDESDSIEASSLYRLTQEVKSGTTARKMAARSSSFQPHHAGRGASLKKVTIRMAANGVNGH